MKLVLTIAVLLLISLSASLADDVQQLTLREAGEAIYYHANDPKTPEVVASVIERIRSEKVPSIDPELFCLSHVVIYDRRMKNDFKNTKILLDIMNEKYKDHSDDRMKLLLYEMVFYSGSVPDQEKMAKVMKQAEEENIEMQNRHAIASMRYLVVSGESYYRLSGNMPGETLDKARQCLKDAIAIKIFQPIYEPSYKELKALYLRAAIGLVNMTHEPQELKKLWFALFTLDELGRMFPDKVLYINNPRANPGRIRIEGTVTDWLHDMISDLDKNDAIIPHMSAVLDYLRERNDEEKR
jgi:hypothetical protein